MSVRAARSTRGAVGLLAAGLVAACAAQAADPVSSGVPTPPTSRPSPSATTTSPAGTTPTTTTTTPTTSTIGSTSTTTTTTTSTTSTTTTSTTSTTTTTTTTSTTLPAGTEAYALDAEVEIGRSVEGRPITVIRRGTPGGTRVLAVGVIHGNEDAGAAIIDRLAVDPVPDGVELWLVRSMNPDGQARQIRQNANAVDLNRNFPHNWGELGVPGDWQYGGAGPASEPETQAIVALGDLVRPDLILWYHQDLFRINPASGRDGQVRARYAEISGLPLVEVSGGTYTGTASQWSRTVAPTDGIGFTVELGESLDEALVGAHVAAVHAVAVEFF